MAARLGKVLARCALGPLNYAGSLIMASRVAEALNELSPSNLYGGYLRGVDETAKLAGLGRGDVEGALPRGEVRAAADHLAGSQAAALAAWNAHAGQFGGLLAGVADLTVDGRVPDVPLCLERLAAKVARDKDFANPLRALASDVERWQNVLQECHDLLESGGAIHRAYRRRRLRTVGLGVVAGLAISGVAFFGLRVRAAHARVEERLALAATSLGPCAVLDFTDDELAGGSSDQVKRAADLKETCLERRRVEAAAAAEREKKAAEERAVREKKEAREKACAALADHAASGSVGDGDFEVAGASLPLLRRVSKGELDAADLGPASPTFPCADTPAGKKLEAAFASAVLKSAWAHDDDLSDASSASLAAHALDFPLAQRVAFSKHADVVAQRAILGGEGTLLARAAKLCKLAGDFGFPPRGFCPGAIKLSTSASATAPAGGAP